MREFNPDLIICDIMMPRMNGLEFLTALREDKSIAQIPVIMFTAKRRKMIAGRVRSWSGCVSDKACFYEIPEETY